MTDHEHEWYIWKGPAGVTIGCRDPLCSKCLTDAKCEAILNEHVALKRENEAGRLFGVWLQAIWEDEDFRKDGGGRTYAELLDYILACFPETLADTQKSDALKESE